MPNSTDNPKPAQQTTSQSPSLATPPTPVQQPKPSFPKSTMAVDSASFGASKPAFPKSALFLESFDPKARFNKKSAK